MAQDDQNRAREANAEREAEIVSEMKRVDQDPDQLNEGREALGKQSAQSGSPRVDGGELGDDAESQDELDVDEAEEREVTEVEGDAEPEDELQVDEDDEQGEVDAPTDESGAE